ncbi:LCP family protein [Clostridium sp. SYSU_GA19001]|uniref:LCP family protein n=1 Tax=Clostridium caldaquaticum TaxID=2940653 RepID=UPI002076F53B|nr:LCP family protein [Clostridium caldaquaticum]MCM8710676.1 LCP family protein [Clostridium caldaquaticum]
MKLSKNKKLKAILFSFLVIFVTVGSSFAGYTYYQLSKVKITEISKTDEDLGIVRTPSSNEDELNVEMDDDIVNIALFGTDRRDPNEKARTDTIMIATIDKKHKKIKLSSIMRDTYVKINGHGMDKITHAYFYGGPQLAIRTLNENFKLDIRDFVLVDFFSLEKIIDALGGVVIDVKKEEIPSMNKNMEEVAWRENKPTAYVTTPGPQLLNGMQAVGYARIRNVGNGDYERTDRQRQVLNLLFDKVTAAGSLKYPYIVSQILPYTETSIDKSTMLKLGAQVFAANITTIDQQRFPLDKNSRDTKINGVYYLWADLNATAKNIHQFIYETQDTGTNTDNNEQKSNTQQNKKTTTTNKTTKSKQTQSTTKTTTEQKNQSTQQSETTSKQEIQSSEESN